VHSIHGGVRPPSSSAEGRSDEAPRGRVVAPVGEGEADALAEVLARAFRDNPLNRAVIRAEARRRLRSNLNGMHTLLASALGRATILAARPLADEPGSAIAGGLVALPPFGYPLPSPPVWDQLRSAFTQGFGVVRRWGHVFQALADIHPSESHWYLSVLGVDPERQGRGHGAALIERWLERVDAEEAAAYLETDRRENIAFYSRAGFRVLDERKVLGVEIWRMWRVHRVGGIEAGQMPAIEPESPGDALARIGGDRVEGLGEGLGDGVGEVKAHVR
jgi:ribosomal protein S18 acetylase RimI-like enzyme